MGWSLFLALIFVLIYALYSDSKAKQRTRVGSSVFCDANGNLTLRNRSADINSVIKVERMLHSSMTYHPANYVYTGATVGGVTTGGITKTGDYTSLDGYATNKYRLSYNNDTTKTYIGISKIKIANKSLLEEAKKHKFISTLLEDDTIVLNLKDAKDAYSPQEIALMVKAGDLSAVSHMVQSNEEAHGLSKTQCQTVLDWMCYGA